MKKILFGIVWVISFILILSSTNADSIANIKLTESNQELRNLVSDMLKETHINSSSNMNRILTETRASDEIIRKRFQLLSNKQKNKVILLAKTENMKKSGIQEDKQDLLKEVIDLIDKEDKYIWDLSEDELKLYVNSINVVSTLDNTLITQSSSSCPVKSFPDIISYVEKPTYTSYVSTYYYSNVATEIGETPCDTELWYNTSKDRVWWTNFLTRDMINWWYGGKLSKRTSSGDDRIVIGYWGAFSRGLTDYWLSQSVVIW